MEKVLFHVYCCVLCSKPVCLPVDYHFTDREVMEEAIGNNEFIEFTQFSGNFYGTRYVQVAACRGLKLTSVQPTVKRR